MKQLSAMGNRRQYYRNSNSSRNLPQQPTLNEQINLNGTLLSQQSPSPVSINLTPALVNRQMQSQPVQNQILNSSNILSHNNSQLNIGNSISQSSLGQLNSNNSYELQNENSELMNGNIISNNSLIGNNSPNYLNNPGNKLPISYNMNNYFN
jgi:hypothetical protein